MSCPGAAGGVTPLDGTMNKPNVRGRPVQWKAHRRVSDVCMTSSVLIVAWLYSCTNQYSMLGRLLLVTLISNQIYATSTFNSILLALLKVILNWKINSKSKCLCRFDVK